MNTIVPKISVWPIIVLIIIVAYANRTEAVQVPVDMPLPGESAAATNDKRNADKKTKWGYCYEPEAKIVTIMNDNEYRSYHCTSESGWTGYFDIFYKGKKVYSERVENGNFFICDPDDPLDDCSDIPAPGKDINGDGIPEMVMERHLGTHQNNNRIFYPIYSIGKKVRKLVTIDGMYSTMEFADLDGDGRYEMTGEDWVLAYFFGDFVSSPHPTIILKWQKGAYHLGYKLMKKTSPTKKELKKKADELKKAFDEENGPFLEGYIVNAPDYQHAEAWFYLVDLIYSGNAKSAWAFLDMYWVIPPGCTKFKERKQEKRDFVAALKKQLSRSFYWKDLKALNSWY